MSEHLPLVALRSSVLFPRMVMPLAVGRSRSLAAVERAAGREDKMLVIVCQRDPSVEEPGRQDLYDVGTRALIKRLARVENAVQLVVQGLDRVRLVGLGEEGGGLVAEVEPLPDPGDSGPQVEALQREVMALAQQLVALAGGQEVDISQLPVGAEDPLHLVWFLAAMMNLEAARDQELLEATSREEALRRIHQHLGHEAQIMQLRQKIASQVETEMSEEKRRYLLRQQLRAIQQELGEEDPEQAEADLLREQLEETELPEEVRKEAERELRRLQRLPRSAPDYQLIRSYLELVLELPWYRTTEDCLDLSHARQVLDEDHYGLQEIKERILEHLAVMKLNPRANAPILCFVGAPGVGKTSLGQSIARALGRKFERFSLGGLHDEAELRGHRRTYIGALPGRLIQAVRRAGVKNPLLMLDEVDKLGHGFRGDPAAALLEILDPAQNHTFRDNYLDLPFDLSKVFFITTANTLETIPRPLVDRMEVIRLSGYTEREKHEIARRYLLPRKFEEAGLPGDRVSLDDEVLLHIIRRYTREAGVRELERSLARLARKLAMRLAEQGELPEVLRVEDLPELLGGEKYFPERARRNLEPGVAAGLAWTEAGGDVLYVEALLLSGEDGLTLTGHLGDVMKESAQAARSFVLARAEALGIPEERRKAGVHLHVPAGATPKDGPSAGITMAVALATAYTGAVARADTAMTGEITLTGLVLPVGGIKEKMLAAHRAGIRRVVLPAENRKDLREIPEEVRQEMELVMVERLEEVLARTVPDLADRLKAAPAA